MPLPQFPAPPIAARPGVASHRVPVLALAAASLLGGLAGGLARLGTGSPSPDGAAAGHGVLMTLGFLGTLIALERAVALRRAWGYLAPILSGVGGLAIIVGVPAPWPPLLMAAAGAWLCAGYVVMWQRQPTLHITVEALGALAWWGCAMVWLTGTDLPGLAPQDCPGVQEMSFPAFPTAPPRPILPGMPDLTRRSTLAAALTMPAATRVLAQSPADRPLFGAKSWTLGNGLRVVLDPQFSRRGVS